MPRSSSLTARAWAGPLIVGLAVWCAAGTLTVASRDSATGRLAIAAPWWVLAVAIGAAGLVPMWRRDIRTALPALLTILPWIPLPLPALALFWTGPLAWAPIAAALAAAVGVAPLRAAFVGLAAALGAGDARRAPVLAAIVTLAVGLLAAWSLAPHLLGGDEPHYLVISQSLLRDGDLKIENNHRDPDYMANVGAACCDSMRRGRDGAIYSIHAPGLPVLALPAYAAFGYRGAQATVLLMAALCGALIWRIGWRASGQTGAAWFAWAAVVGSATFLIQGVSIFPDGPGALMAAAGLLLVMRLDAAEPVGTGALVGTSVMLALLPWLHTRFAILAGVLGALVLIRLLTDATRPLQARLARAAAFLAIPIVSAAGWLAYFQLIYGTPNPTAPYNDISSPNGNHLIYTPGGLTALLFDEQFGLFSYTPILLVTIAGAWSLWRAGETRLRRAAIASVAIAGLYLASATTYWMWWAGVPAPPARLATAVLPVCAAGIAFLWSRASPSGRRALAGLLGLSLAITAILLVVQRGDLAWNDRDAEARWLDWLSPIVNLSRGWPSFFLTLNPDRLVASIDGPAVSPVTELPFVRHVAIVLGLVIWEVLALRAWWRQENRAPHAVRTAIAWSFLVCPMLITLAGWYSTGSNALDPSASQLAVARHTATGASLLEIGPAVWRVRAQPPRTFAIGSAEPGVKDPSPPWLLLTNVPAGDYDVRVTQTRPRAGLASVLIGRSPQPIVTFALRQSATQTIRLSLPAGAGTLQVTPDAGHRQADGRVELVPVAVRAFERLAVSAARYGATQVFFLDDHVFVEGGGFWVKGGQTSEMLWAAGGRQGSIAALVRNGGTRNDITLQAGAWRMGATLEPSETREIEIPVTDASGTVTLRVSSTAGFRPSEKDPRYLGVWIEPR